MRYFKNRHNEVFMFLGMSDELGDIFKLGSIYCLYVPVITPITYLYNRAWTQYLTDLEEISEEELQTLKLEVL